MSDANRVAVRIVEEVTAGTTPATPVFQELAITQAPDLQFKPVTTQSQRIKSNRRTSDLPLVGAEAGGSVGHELSFEQLDIILQAGMFSTWDNKAYRNNGTVADSMITNVSATAYTVVATGLNALSNAKTFSQYQQITTAGFTNPGNNGNFQVDTGATTTNVPILGGGRTVEAAPPAGASIRVTGILAPSADLALAITPNRITSTLVNFVNCGLVVGEWIKVGSGVVGETFTTGTWSANGFWARISAVAAGSLTLDRFPIGFAADTGTGKTIQIGMGDRLIEGTTKRYHTIEEEFGDITNLYQYFTGMVVEQMEFAFDTQAIVGVTTQFQGLGANFLEAGRFAGATTVATAARDILNTSSNVPRIGEGGVQVTTPNIVQSGGLTVNNNLRRINGVGRIGAYDIAAGRSLITGKLSTIFGDATLAKKVINNTASSFDSVFESTNQGTALVFDCPYTKYSEGAPSVPGIDQDNTVDLSFQALEDPTLGYQLLIQRFWATT